MNQKSQTHAHAGESEDIQELLNIAVKNNNIENIEIALAKGAKPTYELLDQTYIAQKDSAIVRLLIKSAADIGDLLKKTITHKQKELTTFLLTDAADKINDSDEINVMLEIAIRKEQNDAIALLLDHPKCNLHLAVPKSKGKQVIHFAAIDGDMNIIRMLIEKGASIKTLNEAGETAINLAEKHHPKIVDSIKKIYQKKNLRLI